LTVRLGVHQTGVVDVICKLK